MLRVAKLAAAGLCCGFYLGCADLPQISADVCGNGVVEPARGEDCDGKGAEGTTCGAPGTTHACRYLCTAEKDCPTGYGCGVDGLCRASSGTWSGPAVVTRHTAETPLDVMVSDMDGDGKGDVFAEAPTTLTVDYELASTQTGQTILRDAALPVVGPVVDLSGDHRADAVIPTDLGFFVELGTQTRTERATAYSAINLPDGVADVQAFTAELIPEQPGLENLVIAMITIGAQTDPLLVDVSTLGTFTIIGKIPDAPSKLAGPPRSGRFNEDVAALPCETLVFGYKGHSTVDVLVPCKATPQGTMLLMATADMPNTPETQVSLPSGATIAGPITIADLDRDGHLDLLVPAARGSGFEIDVAYGRGDGTFASSAGTDPTTHADGSAGVSVHIMPALYAEPGPYPPLAVGDLDGDKRPDWVDTTGAYLSRGKDPPFPVAHDDVGGAWKAAAIAKLNGDDLPDVAIGVNQAVVFLLNNGGGVFTPFPVGTPGTVSLILPGDFDGDLVGDLAVVTNAAASNNAPAADTLSVVYGSPFGAPSEPKEIGEFHHITEIARGSAPAGQLNVLDGADELGALAEMEDGTTAFAIIFGRGDRRLRSPYDLAVASFDQGILTAYAPLRIIPADIDGDGVTDLASLGQNINDTSKFRIWANPMQGEASLTLSKRFYSDDLQQGFGWTHVLMGAVDLDGTPGDEIAFLGPRADGTGYQYSIAHSIPPPDPTMGPPMTYTLSAPTKLAQTFTRSEEELTDPSMHNGRMRIADIDGDGKKDVVALGQDGKNGTVVVFFNDGTGDLGTPVAVNGAEKLDIRDFALTPAGADGKLRIVLLTTTGVYLVVGHDRELAASAAPALSMSAGTPTSPSLIAAGDIDGDGVPDLALGGPLGYEVHLGISANPLDFR